MLPSNDNGVCGVGNADASRILPVRYDQGDALELRRHISQPRSAAGGRFASALALDSSQAP